MTNTSIFIVYICGLLNGVILTIVATLYFASKALKKTKEKLKVENDKLSVEERLSKVRLIIEQQLDLQAGADGPQKNSLHGKFKNGLMGEVRRLEDEKIAILNSILADGFDPEVTVMNEQDVLVKIKLSEFMAQQGMKTTPPAQEEKVKNLGKFTVIKGGKSDGEGETTH